MAFTLVQYRQGLIDPFAVTPILVFFARRFGEHPSGLAELQWQIYRQAIVPLASTPHLLSFLNRIEAVVRLLGVERPSELVKFVVYLTRVFPYGRLVKQIPFIGWMERMAASVQRSDFGKIVSPLFGIYAELALCDASSVVEASFKIWENGKLIPVIVQHSPAIYPIMYPAITKASHMHWKQGTQHHAFGVLTTMRDCNQVLFDKLVLRARNKKTARGDPADSGDGMRIWTMIAREAGHRDKTLPLSAILAELGRFYKTC